jgi:hypothetical protein
MTKEELEARATHLEILLDFNAIDDPDAEIAAEEELCKIYMMLKKMNQLEAE